MSFICMAIVTICSDFGAQENKVSVSIVSPSTCHEVIGPVAMILAQQWKVSWVLSLLYGPTLTSTHDYYKKQRFHYMDLCLQSDISAFECTV